MLKVCTEALVRHASCQLVPGGSDLMDRGNAEQFRQPGEIDCGSGGNCVDDEIGRVPEKPWPQNAEDNTGQDTQQDDGKPRPVCEDKAQKTADRS
ncbi:hypothetical protein ACO34A_24500 (plasmid) [Rhizobium sp. ACO-34A]|nr:hypothetical protein ACO34A_24500 [Rhizobium sp. ACO-34A]